MPALQHQPPSSQPSTISEVSAVTPMGPVTPLGSPRTSLSRIARSPRHPARTANLESEGQSARMRLGIIALAVALALLLGLQALEAPRLWRAFLFVPFFLALFGATQALYRTCPSLASRGVREVCGSEEPVARASERQRSRQLGHRVLWLSALGAVIATVVFLLLP